MLFKVADAEAIAAGRITCTIRRWKRAQARVGGVYRSPVGHIRVTSLEILPLRDVAADDVHAAGFRDLAELREAYGGELDDRVHVVRFEPTEPPPRLDPGARADLTDEELADLLARLDALDRRSPAGPWTQATLLHIGADPGTRSPDMASALGREQKALKADVRKLKRLGLTRSLERGYELSPRGRAFLDASRGASGAR